MTIAYTNPQITTYRILDATIDNPDLADPLNLGESGVGKGIILWGDTSLANIEWDEESDRLLTTSATIRMGTTDHLEFRDAGLYIHSPADGELAIVSDGTGGSAITLTAGSGGLIRLANASEIDAAMTFTGANKLQFRDTGSYIYGWADGYLQIYSDGTDVEAISLVCGAGGKIQMNNEVRLILGATVSGDQKIQFRDSGAYIHSNADGYLTIYSDGTDVSAITLAAGAGATIQMNSQVGFILGGIVSGDQKMYFYDTGLYIHSPADGELAIVSDGTGGSAITLTAGSGGLIRLASASAIDDAMTFGGVNKVQFRDSGAYINSPADGYLTIYSDGTDVEAINLVTGSGGEIQMGSEVYFVKGWKSVGFANLWNTNTVSSREADIWYDVDSNKIHFWDGVGEREVQSA